MEEHREESVFSKIYTDLSIDLGVINFTSQPLSSCLKAKSNCTNYWDWELNSNAKQRKKTVRWSQILEEIVFFQREADSWEDTCLQRSSVKNGESTNSTVHVQKDLERLINLKKSLFTSSNDSFGF